MRIGFVSTFPPMRCAIGIYTQNLGNALAATSVARPFVAAEDDGSGPPPEGPMDVQQVYRRDNDYRGAVFDAVTAARCDVVHFQYAPDLFGEDERLPALVERLSRAGLRPLVTLHTVYGARRWRALFRRPTTQAWHRKLAEHAMLVVHHSEGMETELVAQGIPRNNIAVIPHGTTVSEPVPMEVARKNLRVPEDCFLFTFFGFIHRLKNVHTAVEGFLRAAEEMPRARLLVMGMPWGDRWYNHLYVGAIRARIAASRAKDRVEIRDSYVSPDLVSDIYGASNVILLPHRQSYGSASGVFHQAIGFQKPVLAARGPKFVEASSLFRGLDALMVNAGSSRAWAESMRRIYGDAALRASASLAVADFAEKSSWPTVAAQHAALYERLVSSRA